MSKGSDRICYHEVSTGSVSFDIWRCLKFGSGCCFEVSKGSGTFCYLPSGSVSFDIMRCLEVLYLEVSRMWIGFVVLRCLEVWIGVVALRCLEVRIGFLAFRCLEVCIGIVFDVSGDLI